MDQDLKSGVKILTRRERFFVEYAIHYLFSSAPVFVFTLPGFPIFLISFFPEFSTF